jgi:transcriptional regulator with XRE-family HTH domain
MAAAAFRQMLGQDRLARGFTVGQVAWRLGVTPAEYRELETGEGYPNFETWDRICKLYGWPQTFVGSAARP